MQRNWIGRSEGSEIDFALEGGEKIRVFTTRVDTIYRRHLFDPGAGASAGAEAAR